MFSDSHVHIDFARSEDWNGIIERAVEAQVGIIVTAGMDLPSSRKAVEIAEKYDIVYAGIGFHPWNANQIDKTTLNQLRSLSDEDSVFAFSEIGLDFSRGRIRDPLPKKVQLEAFQRQVRLAVESHIPLIIHVREAWDEAISIIEQESASEIGGAIHGFSGDVKIAHQFIDVGFRISIGGRMILSPEKNTTHNVVREIPLDQLLLDTDFTAHEHSLEPAKIVKIARKVAELRKISVELVGETTTSTLKQLLGI